MSRASLDKQPTEVAAMFDGVASAYDRTNTILSFGRDRMLAPSDPRVARPARRGTLPRPCRRHRRVHLGARPVRRLHRGRRPLARDAQVGRALRPDASLLAADALALPFADASFDAVTISFGLRNIVDTGAALRELARVTRPGGRLVVCEFSAPVNRAFRTAYLGYLMRALPAVARRVSSNPDAYVYLAESIRAWPDQAGLAARIGANGWASVTWRNLTGGIVALHRATRA